MFDIEVVKNTAEKFLAMRGSDGKIEEVFTGEFERAPKKFHQIRGNVFFRARLRPVGYEAKSRAHMIFRDDDSQEEILFSLNGIKWMLKALCDGDMVIKDGAIEGRFHIKRYGPFHFAEPC